jgi:cardiolipin synthase A/B
MWQPAFWILVADWSLRITFSVWILLRKRSASVTLAWLLVVLIFPFGGAFIFLLLADNRLCRVRARWAQSLQEEYSRWLSRLDIYRFTGWENPREDVAQMSRMIEIASGALPLSGNQIEMHGTSDEAFQDIITEIDRAKRTCFLEYYIWESGGLADQVANSLMAAAQRGVDCRVLVDAVGSWGFLRGKQVNELRAAGVVVHAALPVGLIRSLFYRFDLRLHRKIVVIDHRIGFIGSKNMADPRFFKRTAGVGEWVDAMIRLEGPAVDPVSMIFLEDWYFETSSSPEISRYLEEMEPPSPRGSAITQVVPSGPGIDSEAITQLLIGAIYSADWQLTITTPYFIPDTSLQRALIIAARRGVAVTLVLPERVDSTLVRLASRSAIRELAEAGVSVMLYQKGLLHTKSITIDGEMSVFGSLNLDPRSIQLNFEMMLVLYDKPFTAELIALQEQYIADSRRLIPSEQPIPSLPVQLLESCVKLISPLL